MSASPREPLLQVKINVPASLYQRMREHALLTKTSISQLCRDGALRELDQLEALKTSGSAT